MKKLLEVASLTTSVLFSFKGRFSHGFDAYPALCQTNTQNNPRQFLGKIYFDSLVHDEAALQLLISVAGEDKVGWTGRGQGGVKGRGQGWIGREKTR